MRIYIYISRKTLRSLRPEIGEFACRAWGQIKSGQSKIRAGRGQKTGQGMMGIVQFE